MKKYIHSKEDLHKKLNEGYKIYSDSWENDDEFLFLKGDRIYDETMQEVCFLEDLDLDHSMFYLEKSLTLKRIDWYISGAADYVITKKGDDFFISIDDLEEIPFEEIKRLVSLVEDLK